MDTSTAHNGTAGAVSPNILVTQSQRLTECAKGALERVCSGAALDPAERYYSAGFVDHVNDLEFRGAEGIRRSVELYRKLLSDISITVKDQLTAGDKVTSRFVVFGTSYGRRVSFNGITISRFERDLIVEDWSVTDTLGMLRQLGVLRALLVGLRSIGHIKALVQ
jgi:predicted ester cyclase